MAVTDEVYNVVMEYYNYQCAECGTTNNLQWHHKLPKTKVNIRRFPLFINSTMNGVILCGGFADNCHEKKKHIYKIREREAEMHEKFLRSLLNGKF